VLTKQKLAPTNKIVDSIYDKYVLPNHKFNRKKDIESKNITGKGKLTEHQIDLIKYFASTGIKLKLLAAEFGITVSSVNRIRNDVMFSNYISPFEVKERFGFKVVDQFKLKNWIEENIEEINSIKLSMENSFGS
jgi:hypothetical protein